MKNEEIKEELCDCGCHEHHDCDCGCHEHNCDCGEKCDCGDDCDCGCHHEGINCGYDNPIDALLDPNCEENIVLFDELDKPTEFEQIAIIPIDNSVYAILKPVDKLEGLEEDAAIVFELAVDENGDDNLQAVIDEKILDKVYEEYEKLIAESK